MGKPLFIFMSIPFLIIACLSAGCELRDKHVIELQPMAEGAKLFPNWELVHRSTLVRFAAFSESGKLGWAIDPAGELLQYREGQWIPATDIDELALDYTSIWVAPNENVWLASNSSIALLQDKHLRSWLIPRSPAAMVQISRSRARTFVQDALGAAGVWIIGPDGKVSLFREGEFEVRSAGSPQLELLRAPNKTS